MNWITLGEFLVFRVIGPLVVGFVVSYAIHWGVGEIANATSNGDREHVANWAKVYIRVVFQLKDYLFVWALGIIVFMALGLV